MSEKEIVEKTEVPATVESLQADLHALRRRTGNGRISAFVLECNGMGVWRICGGYRCPAESLGFHWNACNARPLARPDRTERLGKSTRPRVVVAGNTREYAGLRSRAYPHSFHGHYLRDISQAKRRPPQRTSAGLVFVHVDPRHRASPIITHWPLA